MGNQVLDSLKVNLIVEITHFDDEKSLREIEDAVVQVKKRLSSKQLEMIEKLSKPMREKLDIDELIKEQNWKPSMPEEIRELIKEIDFQATVEELIEEINDI